VNLDGDQVLNFALKHGPTAGSVIQPIRWTNRFWNKRLKRNDWKFSNQTLGDILKEVGVSSLKSGVQWWSQLSTVCLGVEFQWSITMSV
jgi:hypothetical protein